MHKTAALLLTLACLMAGHVARAGDLDKAINFDVEAQTLDKALLEFGAQAHVQIMFAWDSATAALRIRGLKGRYTGKDALAQLLKGTRLKYIVDGNTVEIQSQELTPNTGPARSGPTSVKPLPIEGPKAVDPPPARQSHTRRSSSKVLREVLVTGTHIRGAPLSSPVTRITRQEIDRSGYTTAGALIQSLPDDFGDSGPQTPIGAVPSSNGSISGGFAPNLYGLGAASTLTLVDGQRLAVDSATGSVDISLIPLPVIDHIDVLSGGASAIYGSDAVAGVVNFVLVKDFHGSKTTLLGGGTADGGGAERDVNEMLGETWSGGSAILDYESYVQNPILAPQRDYTNTAGPLTTTLAGTSRSSFFVSAHDKLGGTISAFVTGLYTHRSTHSAFSFSSLYPSVLQNANVHQFAADGGLNVALPSEWSLSLVGDYSENRTDNLQSTMGSPPGSGTGVLNEGLTNSFEATANGPILRIASGKVRGATGLGYRRETFSYDQGAIFGSPGARRTVRYAYGEVSIPLVTPENRAWRRELALDISGRFERYSDFGNESVPKIGLVYVPFSTIHVRGTWGKAFRAPSLYQLNGIQEVLYIPRPDALSETGVSDVLLRAGGNPDLKPEKARTWTIGIDYLSKAVEGLRASVTYFDIAYRGRIGRIADQQNALINPLDAPFVTRNPSEGLVQSVLNSATVIANIVGSPINPASVPAIIDARGINVASEDIAGGDVEVRYRRGLALGEIEPFMNAALLDMRQRLVPGAPESEVSGLVFQPPKVRVRTGVSWLIHGWTVTGIVNYRGSEINTYQPSDPHVASWTTLDVSVGWQPENAGVLGGLKLNLSVENALNRDPPFVQFSGSVPGIHYDGLNANPLGRAMRAGVSWLLQ